MAFSNPPPMSALARIAFAGVFLSSVVQAAWSGPLLDKIAERRAARHEQAAQAAEQDGLDEDDSPSGVSALPANTRVVRNVSYGRDQRQRFDVYLPAQAHGAPVIFMVHGGGWRRGDKAMRTVVENKLARWVPKGFIFISANYRMLPDTDPVEQARDVARALAAAQRQAATWGGDPGKFIVMGHSAGSHLVSLMSSSPSLSLGLGVTPWLGTIALDSAAFDVVRIMEGRHMRLYDKAFGNDAAYWRAASPLHVIGKAGAPMLAVCSTRREESCAQASAFAGKAESLGTRVAVLREDKSHREINEQLGEEGSYTRDVEAFMRTLDGSVAGILKR